MRGVLLATAKLAVCNTMLSAFRSPHLGPVFKQLREKYRGGDMFHEIVFHLVRQSHSLSMKVYTHTHNTHSQIYEKYVLGPDSYWAPYLDYLPTRDEMLFPYFFT